MGLAARRPRASRARYRSTRVAQWHEARGKAAAMSDASTITGATRLYAIIGDPIAQVRSPEVFTRAFRRGAASTR